MKTHAEIIADLGIRRLAQTLGHPNPTTVQGWHKRNRIPVERWAEVVHAAETLEKPLSVTELMPEELRGAA